MYGFYDGNGYSVSKHVELFDFATSTWVTKPEMPLGVADNEGAVVTQSDGTRLFIVSGGK